jgi:hypothetical protein
MEAWLMLFWVLADNAAISHYFCFLVCSLMNSEVSGLFLFQTEVWELTFVSSVDVD